MIEQGARLYEAVSFGVDCQLNLAGHFVVKLYIYKNIVISSPQPIFYPNNP